jgi:hypothetical protein
MRAFCMVPPVAPMRFTPLRLFLPALSLLVLAGCASTNPCGGNDEYLKAQERPRLNLPPGVFGSERIAPTEIPPAAPDPYKLDPQPRCLDYPPQFFARPPAEPGTPEAVVRDWGTAWAQRRPDVVMQAYAPSFEAPGKGGSAAFLTEREQQVASGPAPSPTLLNLVVTKDGSNRRVVTFIQVFGKEEVHRELTLVRDGDSWRIEAERTLTAP